MPSDQNMELARLEEKINQTVMINGKILQKLEEIERQTPRRVSTIEGRAALPVARAAETLGMSIRTLRKLIAAGRINAAIVDRIYLIPAYEIERFLGIGAMETRQK